MLFSNCIMVKGARRSLICDLQKDLMIHIPNDLHDVFNKFKKGKVSAMLDYYGPDNHETILSYFRLLHENEFIFITEDKDLLDSFPPLDLQWDAPSVITNAIIDFDENKITLRYFKTIIEQLDDLNCKYIQLRFFSAISKSDVFDIISKLNNSCINHVEFVLPYNIELVNSECLAEILNERRISNIVFYNAPEYDCKTFEFSLAFIALIPDKIISEHSCGKIHANSFTSNIKLFTEAQNHNTCLNRKIGIDKGGNIKNCPSMRISFGHIFETKIKDVLNNDKFTYYWNIHKDNIGICKDCEYRYVCVDCRAYIEDSSNVFSKPLKCGYNPYLCTWEDWTKNPLKALSIVEYNL